jgi:hypothetical protein
MGSISTHQAGVLKARDVFDLGLNIDSLSSAMRLTTILTTIRVCPLHPPKFKTLTYKATQTSTDSLGRAADVWGQRVMSSYCPMQP